MNSIDVAIWEERSGRTIEEARKAGECYDFL